MKNPNIDYNKYVLKESIPPVRQCPPCVCPKVTVSAGLCKECPPPPKCPPPERCPIVKCPEPKPYVNNLKCPEPKPCPSLATCPEPKPCEPPIIKYKDRVKYIKVPTFISRKDNSNKNNNNNKNERIQNNSSKKSKHVPKGIEDHSSLNNKNYQKCNLENHTNNNNHLNYKIKDLNSVYTNAAHPIKAKENFFNL